MLFKFPRVFLAAASATSILALSSCVLPTSLPTSSVSGQAEASQSSAPAADNTEAANAKGLPNHTIGEVLEIGKYLPEQNGQEAFHPCRDLTKEQWNSLGLEVEPYDPQKDVLSVDSTLCQPKMKEQTKDSGKSVTIMADYRDIKDYYAQFECYLRKSVFATTLAVKWIFAGSSNSTYVVAGLEQTLEYKL